MSTDTLLEVSAASKSYRGMTAVDDAGLAVRHGQIHGLIGPNGAGKTTLLNIISGHAAPDRGTVTFAGAEITRWRTERRARVGLVRTFQDCRLLEDLTVAENLWLGAELARRMRPMGPSGDAASATLEQDVGFDLLASLGLEHRLDVAVRDLSSGERKATEVGRALAAGARVLLLDEPFSGLTRAEVDLMLAALRRLRDSNCSVLLVEHNLGAVFELCDEVTAMDKAKVVACGPAAEVRDDARVKEAFFGADGGEGAELAASRGPSADGSTAARRTEGPVLLSVRDLRGGYNRTRILHGVSIEAERGIAVGLVGANGAGKTTLFRTIMGLASVHGGTVQVDGEPLKRLRPDVAVASGISFCPQGRHLFPSLTVEENLRLGIRGARSRGSDAGERVDGVFEVLPDLATFRRKTAGALSGGQQQLLAIGRALMSSPKVLLLDEPSTGLSVGAVRLLSHVLRRLTEQGLAIVLAEQNLGFALTVCERGYVMESGCIVAAGSHEVLERAWELTIAEVSDVPAGPAEEV